MKGNAVAPSMKSFINGGFNGSFKHHFGQSLLTIQIAAISLEEDDNARKTLEVTASKNFALMANLMLTEVSMFFSQQKKTCDPMSRLFCDSLWSEIIDPKNKKDSRMASHYKNRREILNKLQE